jgi:hypothetical protein
MSPRNRDRSTKCETDDTRQGLAAEPERTDGRKIVRPRDFARRMTLEAQARILSPHAVAVILDADYPLAAELDIDLDSPGAGVDGVLDQLLDD